MLLTMTDEGVKLTYKVGISKELGLKVPIILGVIVDKDPTIGLGLGELAVEARI